MIHKLLLVLCGYPARLFLDVGLQVSPELPLFLHLSEAALLARVCCPDMIGINKYLGNPGLSASWLYVSAVVGFSQFISVRENHLLTF
uniref:Uncharacterized protein n=1 Tax=Pseudonaja textilis TaxID=8673 RepID=A0A670Z927_PSETE